MYINNCLSSGEWREREKERFGARGPIFPMCIFPLKDGEPFGATNRVSQPSNRMSYMENVWRTYMENTWILCGEYL